MEVEQGSFVPADLARRVQALHRFRAEEKRLAFRVLTGPGTDTPRQGDGHRILQVLNNLVSNAIKFTEAGDVTVRIEIAPADAAAASTADTPPTPERLLITVADSGIGMDEAQLARVFDEFVQADSSVTRRYGGTGLGLSISRRLAELLGGTLTLDSRPGAGTTARLDLPAPGIEATATPLPTAAPGPTGQTRPPVEIPAALRAALPRGLRVVFADDNGTNRLLMGKMLARLGITAQIVDCGIAAVEAATDPGCDLLLLDISMPDITGIEALARIRAADAAAGRPRRPAIAVTANALHHQVSEYLAAGFDGHVGKPIRLAELAAGIAAVLPDPAKAPIAPPATAPAPIPPERAQG